MYILNINFFYFDISFLLHFSNNTKKFPLYTCFICFPANTHGQKKKLIHPLLFWISYTEIRAVCVDIIFSPFFLFLSLVFSLSEFIFCSYFYLFFFFSLVLDVNICTHVCSFFYFSYIISPIIFCQLKKKSHRNIHISFNCYLLIMLWVMYHFNVFLK